MRARILEATYSCVARWGLAKTTVEDAARYAGVSRATVYRYFPGGRDELIQQVIAWEFAQFFGRLYEAVRDAASLEEVMERGIMLARESLVHHEVLQRVVQTDPDVLLPKITVESSRIRRVIAAFLVPYIRRHGIAAGVDETEAADFLARMVLSYIASPGRWDLTDRAAVRELVRTELLPGIVVGPEPAAGEAPTPTSGADRRGPTPC